MKKGSPFSCPAGFGIPTAAFLGLRARRPDNFRKRCDPNTPIQQVPFNQWSLRAAALARQRGAVAAVARCIVISASRAAHEVVDGLLHGMEAKGTKVGAYF